LTAAKEGRDKVAFSLEGLEIVRESRAESETGLCGLDLFE
jgi:hypothetical protein